MSVITSEIISSFFFDGAEAPISGNIRIDILDSWRNTGLAAVNPSTFSAHHRCGARVPVVASYDRAAQHDY